MPVVPDDAKGLPNVADRRDPGLRAWIEYLRDMGVYDLYQRAEPTVLISHAVREQLLKPASARTEPAGSRVPQARSGAAARQLLATHDEPARTAPRQPMAGAPGRVGQPAASRIPFAGTPAAPVNPPDALAGEPVRSYFHTESEGAPALPPELAAPMPTPNPLETLLPPPGAAVPAPARAQALQRVHTEIGDCTRCPLAYAGRHTIVFGEGNPTAELMFVGEGPGADEDASGRPFVGKAGQLLNNMIGAMGLQREQVYIANIVKCRPPGNRTPEFVEATTCSQFLLQQIDIVRPKVIVALGSTAATYVLGVRRSLASMRGQWFKTRDAKVAVTYHPAFLLRDPRQKAEAWKDLQRVMAELGLRPAAARG